MEKRHPEIFLFFNTLILSSPPHLCLHVHPGTAVIQLTATDADDPTYGNSARVVYSILEGQPYFSVDAKTGTTSHTLPSKKKKHSVTTATGVLIHYM